MIPGAVEGCCIQSWVWGRVESCGMRPRGEGHTDSQPAVLHVTGLTGSLPLAGLTLGGLRETLLPLLSRRRVDLPWHLGGKLIWLYDYHTYYDFLKWVHSVPTIGRCCDSFNHIKRDKILRKLGMFLLTELDCIFLYIIFAYLTISSRKSREVGWLDTCNSSDCLLRTRYSFHPDRQSAGTYGQALLVRLNEYKNKNCVPDGNPAHCSEILMEKYKPNLPSTFLKRKKST